MEYLGFERLPGAGDLPVFRRTLVAPIPGARSQDGWALYYAPGYLVRADGEVRAEIERTIASERVSASSGRAPALSPLAMNLVRYAREAQARWETRISGPFQPLCLTVYPTNRCNLRCEYCYAAGEPGEPSQAAISLDALREAARIVAGNCRVQGHPFTLVVHGGGEPTLVPSELEAIVTVVVETANAYRLPVFKYIATNGVMPPSRVRWLARTFDLVGLSCDGPGNIQAKQRPLLSGKSSTPFVEQTADILYAARRPFNVRVTVTPEVVERQDEIVRYICARLRPREIHIEPVYRGGRAVAGLGGEEAGAPGRFVEHFLRAQAAARDAGARLVYTGARPAEIHGPYCQVLRDVLNLVPGGASGWGTATACFKLGDAGQAQRMGAVVGGIGEEGFEIDHERLQSLRKLLAANPPRCQGCFNRYHCARGCPDACPLENPDAVDDFRCAVQMRLAAVEIERAAALLPAEPTSAGIRLPRYA